MYPDDLFPVAISRLFLTNDGFDKKRTGRHSSSILMEKAERKRGISVNPGENLLCSLQKWQRSGWKEEQKERERQRVMQRGEALCSPRYWKRQGQEHSLWQDEWFEAQADSVPLKLLGIRQARCLGFSLSTPEKKMDCKTPMSIWLQRSTSFQMSSVLSFTKFGPENIIKKPIWKDFHFSFFGKRAFKFNTSGVSSVQAHS